MLHWCGTAQAQRIAHVWEVFLLGQSLRLWAYLVRGYKYPRPGSLAGWRSAFDRVRFDGEVWLRQFRHTSLADRGTRKLDCNEIWVYTGASDEAARQLLRDLGSNFSDRQRPAPGRTTDDSDVVLKLIIIVPDPYIALNPVWAEGRGTIVFRFF